MNTDRLPLLLLFLCWASFHKALTQSMYQVGVLPSINLNQKLKKNWSVNFKTESRQLGRQGTFQGTSNQNFEYVLTDFSLIAAKKVGLHARLSGGYLIRIRDNQAFHRFIQQWTMVQKLTFLRLAHRVVTDQTLSPDEAAEFRLRYRLSSEIPLNGQSADPGEFYLRINHEILNSLQDAEYDLEYRLVPLAGYGIRKNHKIEAGLDYRVRSFLNRAARHNFWLSLNWYIDLDYPGSS